MNIKTPDIVLSASLRCLGYKMQSFDIVGAKGVFHFENIPEAVISDYDLGNLRVEPVAFNQHIKSLTTAVRRG